MKSRSLLSVLVIVAVLSSMLFACSMNVSGNLLFYEKDWHSWSEDDNNSASMVVHIDAPRNNSRVGSRTEITVVSFNHTDPIIIVQDNETKLAIGEAGPHDFTMVASTNNLSLILVYRGIEIFNRSYSCTLTNVPVVPNIPETQDADDIVSEREAGFQDAVDESDEDKMELMKQGQYSPESHFQEMLNGAIVLTLGIFLFLLMGIGIRKRTMNPDNSVLKNKLLLWIPIIVPFVLFIVIVVTLGPTMENNARQQGYEQTLDFFVAQGKFTEDEKMVYMGEMMKMYPVSWQSAWLDLYRASFSVLMIVVFCFSISFGYYISYPNAKKLVLRENQLTVNRSTGVRTLKTKDYEGMVTTERRSGFRRFVEWDNLTAWDTLRLIFGWKKGFPIVIPDEYEIPLADICRFDGDEGILCEAIEKVDAADADINLALVENAQHFGDFEEDTRKHFIWIRNAWAGFLEKHGWDAVPPEMVYKINRCAIYSPIRMAYDVNYYKNLMNAVTHARRVMGDALQMEGLIKDANIARWLKAVVDPGLRQALEKGKLKSLDLSDAILQDLNQAASDIKAALDMRNVPKETTKEAVGT